MPARSPRDVTPERNPCDGRLSPWADAPADAPGWQITTQSRHLAVAPATTLSGRTVHCHEKGEWQARIPHAVLMVVVTDADADALRCRLSAQSHYSVFALAFAPWPSSAMLKCPLTALPAQGTAIGTRCTSNHAHGPHGALPGPGLRPA